MVLTEATAPDENIRPSTAALPLIPAPAQLTREDGELTLPSLRISGPGETASALARDLSARFGEVADAADAPAGIVLSLDTPASEDDSAAEGYVLDSLGDVVHISAATPAGLFYGTRTLLQLLTQAGDGCRVPRVHIADAPRFAYRGVMLDIARHFSPVDEVISYIDRASALKFNHLHLHLTDDQGWRIQIDAWPLLTELASIGDGGRGPGGFYTKDDYRRIVEHAASRHMTVVPEVDLPGHTHAVGVAYPELVEQPVISELMVAEAQRLQQPLPSHGEHFSGWAVGHSSVRIHDEGTYRFVADVLGELAEMTPGPYLHIGGDECLGTSAEDFATFIERTTRIAAETGKTPIAWHEAGAVPGMAAGTVGQYWGYSVPTGSHAEEALGFIERDGGLIMSPSNRTYLDMKPDADFPLGLTWAGTIPLRDAYDWDPAAIVPGAPESAILGVEAPLWTETVESPADIDALVYPRITAHAEIAWSPREGAERTWDSYIARLSALVPVLRASGIAIDDIPAA
ncbi:beta-N-acetylhexosaminidase [Actinomycetales bacterium SN12]|nr:beta-N-acetylhexosaminidase [Actinomycetales bacterium SN12]